MPAKDLPAEMDCIEIGEGEGPSSLRPARRPLPQPGPGEVLIEVAASGINRADLWQTYGNHPPPKGASDLPGLEAAGVVVAVADDVATPGIGDRVTSLLAGGGYAEYAVATASFCLPAPDNLTLTEAAVLPEVTMTVWHNVVERGQLKAGEWLLVQGGASGIGTTAIQVAKALGARVAVTAGSDEKCARCLEIGADLAINYRTEDFVEKVKAATGDGANVVLDMVGGDTLPRNLEALAPDGRHVNIYYMTGTESTISIPMIQTKRLTLTGSRLRSRPKAFKTYLAGEVGKHIWPMIAAGKLRPVIDRSFPLAEARDAHEYMAASRHIGKLALIPPGAAAR